MTPPVSHTVPSVLGEPCSRGHGVGGGYLILEVSEVWLPRGSAGPAGPEGSGVGVREDLGPVIPAVPHSWQEVKNARGHPCWYRPHPQQCDAAQASRGIWTTVPGLQNLDGRWGNR